MRMALQIFVGIPAMIGVYYLCRWIVTGVSFEFGLGFFLGMMSMAAIMVAVKKVDPDAYYGRDDRAL